ncbi:ALS_1a_G0048640.mRNA.1.CDS.1 [Saccharomyces cerevisiae]|nr:ALS_1a_G0048640.mRNA.1.CDS.1 [Saccharomyces cerevisiae]CAI6877505.1 ALS_1a_G0048640.mRNA.1.CDS.1 [Saccharomyces cerevisiae]
MTSAGLQGPQYVKLQFSRHHRQLRSRYELSLGMHLRDQLALGVTPSKVPHWTAFLSMLIGLFYNKTFPAETGISFGADFGGVVVTTLA